MIFLTGINPDNQLQPQRQRIKVERLKRKTENEQWINLLEFCDSLTTRRSEVASQALMPLPRSCSRTQTIPGLDHV